MHAAWLNAEAFAHGSLHLEDVEELFALEKVLRTTDVVLVLRRLKLHVVSFDHLCPPAWFLRFYGQWSAHLGAITKLVAQESLSLLPESLSVLSRCFLDHLMNRLSAFPRKIALLSHQSLLSQLT